MVFLDKHPPIASIEFSAENARFRCNLLVKQKTKSNRKPRSSRFYITLAEELKLPQAEIPEHELLK